MDFNNFKQIDGGNIPLVISMVKALYKFLLHEYCLEMNSKFISNYKKSEEFIEYFSNLKKYDYIKKMIKTLDTLELIY